MICIDAAIGCVASDAIDRHDPARSVAYSERQFVGAGIPCIVCLPTCGPRGARPSLCNGPTGVRKEPTLEDEDKEHEREGSAAITVDYRDRKPTRASGISSRVPYALLSFGYRALISS